MQLIRAEQRPMQEVTIVETRSVVARVDALRALFSR